jgi:hypothetical protein
MNKINKLIKNLDTLGFKHIIVALEVIRDYRIRIEDNKDRG